MKDETDAQLAIRCAVSRGADSLTLVGRIAGRADHTLSLIFLLESPEKARNRGGDRRRYKQDTSALERSVCASARGIQIFRTAFARQEHGERSSCKYPLERSELVRDNPYATSNEVTGDAAYIEVSGDGVLLIESDRLA